MLAFVAAKTSSYALDDDNDNEDDGDDRDEQKVLQLHFEGWLVNRLQNKHLKWKIVDVKNDLKCAKRI